MKGNRNWLPLLLAALAVTFYASSSVMAQEHHHSAEHEHAMEHHHELEIGKKGAFTFAEEVQIGDQIMKPGRYKFRHREEGDAHFVRFQMIGSAEDTGDVACTLEPLDSKAKRTSIFTDTRVSPKRITRIVVKGENAAHVF